MSGARPEAERGLAAQRTALAWQRTALSLLTGAAVLARLLYPVLGAWALAGFVLSASLSMWVLLVRRPHPSLDDVDGADPRDGLPAAALVLGVAVLGLVELLALGARR